MHERPLGDDETFDPEEAERAISESLIQLKPFRGWVRNWRISLRTPGGRLASRSRGS